MGLVANQKIGKIANSQPEDFGANPQKYGWKKKEFSTFNQNTAIGRRFLLDSFLEGSELVYIEASFDRAKIDGYTDNICGEPNQILVTSNNGGSNFFHCDLNYQNSFPLGFKGILVGGDHPIRSEYSVNYYDNVRASEVPWTLTGFVLLKI